MKRHYRIPLLLCSLCTASLTAVAQNMYMKQKQWKEAANILEKKLMTKLNEIQSALLDSMIIALEEGRDTDAEEIAEISRQTAGLFGLWRFGSYSAPLQLALARQDTGRCVEILKAIS